MGLRPIPIVLLPYLRAIRPLYQTAHVPQGRAP
jgi:hypothetical protein